MAGRFVAFNNEDYERDRAEKKVVAKAARGRERGKRC